MQNPDFPFRPSRRRFASCHRQHAICHFPFVSVLLAFAIVACSVLIPAQALAQDAKGAITDLSEVDEDFAIQGEYSGLGRDAWCRWQHVGLQVAVLGNGRFQGVLYPGGLPGNGWYGGESSVLRGEREGDVVRLAGEEDDSPTVEIRDGYASVLHASGVPVAELTRVKRYSPTLGAAPPPWASVLFDGTHTDHFQNGKMTEDGLLMVGTHTKQAYGDFYLHVEFRHPYMPHASNQGRANSGVYVQQRYEVQILDSFGLDHEDRGSGSLYRYRAPDVNMCFPPLSWQTYDIQFQAARFDSEGEKTADAVITVWHNGIPVHDNVTLTRKTGAGKQEGPDPLPILLQAHGSPVHFRNVWIIDYSPEPAVADVPQTISRPVYRPRRRLLFGR